MLDTDKRQDVIYFIGTEIENTAMKGKTTLFVVGIRPAEEIIAKAIDAGIQHIYFGTSQSFNPKDAGEWGDWHEMIYPLLKNNFWVTLDYDVKYAADIHEEVWHEFTTFIPMISVKIPYIGLNNYNTTLKIDDSTWGKTNPGVWSHPLNELMTRNKFTAWHEYVGDTEIK